MTLNDLNSHLTHYLNPVASSRACCLNVDEDRLILSAVEILYHTITSVDFSSVKIVHKCTEVIACMTVK